MPLSPQQLIPNSLTPYIYIYLINERIFSLILVTGHWSKVPEELREIYSWGSVFLIWFLLKDLLKMINEGGIEDVDLLKMKVMKIIFACDRGLLMGKPLKETVLHEIASSFNKFVMMEWKEEESILYVRQ